MNDNKFCPLTGGECKGSECIEIISSNIDDLVPTLERIADGLDRHNEILTEIAKAVIK